MNSSKPERSLAEDIREVRDLLATSQNLAAVDHAHEALRAVDTLAGEAAQLGYLYALASARVGAPGTAARIIEKLRAAATTDATLAADIESLAGRVAKDTFIETGSDAALNAAILAYQHADQLCPSVHACINAASMLRLAGRSAEATALAQRVAGQLADQQEGDTHWEEATRGEAALLLGQFDTACGNYRTANRRAGRRFGDIASMRHQLQLLARVLPDAARALAEIPGPRVIAFSGHMIDSAGRASPRFPAGIEEAVRGEVERAVAASLPVIGYAQAACGSDILFCEALLAREQEINIVLPFSQDDYIEQSVVRGGPNWLPRFVRVMSMATSVSYATSERYLGDDTLFEHASDLIQGMAFLRAKELAVVPHMLVVSDRSQPGAVGGTLATLETWSSQAKSYEVIDLAAIRAAVTSSPKTHDAETVSVPQPVSRAGRTIKSLLFADVKGFSRLPEEFFPVFFTTFLGLVPKTLCDIGVTPLEISSRGDGLYAVFATPEEAARFAVTLSDAVGAMDWPGMGLPVDTHVRIALHAGPVFTAIDPVPTNWRTTAPMSPAPLVSSPSWCRDKYWSRRPSRPCSPRARQARSVVIWSAPSRWPKAMAQRDFIACDGNKMLPNHRFYNRANSHSRAPDARHHARPVHCDSRVSAACGRRAGPHHYLCQGQHDHSRR